MVGTRQIQRLAGLIDEIDAKLVLVGDHDRLQPIEAGTPFRKLVNAHTSARLAEIHCQKGDWQKKASRDLADGRIADAVKAYDAHGTVRNC